MSTMMTAIKNFLSTLGWYMIRHPLGNMVTAVTFLFLLGSYSNFDDSPTRFDPIILLYAALMSVAVVATILVKTKREAWTALNAGLLGVFLGIVVLFSDLTFREVYGGYEHYQTVLGFARSVFIVSTTWVLAGLFLEWWYNSRAYKKRIFWVLHHPLLAFRQRNTDNSKG